MSEKTTADTPVCVSAKRLWRTRPKRKKFRVGCRQLRLRIYNRPFVLKKFQGFDTFTYSEGLIPLSLKISAGDISNTLFIIHEENCFFFSIIHLDLFQEIRLNFGFGILTNFISTDRVNTLVEHLDMISKQTRHLDRFSEA